jgi:acyl-coenzyme A synthetase/AMP-(fatty) acid ligase
MSGAAPLTHELNAQVVKLLPVSTMCGDILAPSSWINSRMQLLAKDTVNTLSGDAQIDLISLAGMTETSTSICWPPIGVKVCPFGSAGQLMPGVVARIVKEDGSLGKPGERGELVIYSASNALGYVDAPEACVHVKTRFARVD